VKDNITGWHPQKRLSDSSTILERYEKAALKNLTNAGISKILTLNRMAVCSYTVNPALLTSSFVWLIQLCLLHISLFKVIIRKYFSQGKYELMNFLFVLLDKLKIFTL
jgi:hypothetical protein